MKKFILGFWITLSFLSASAQTGKDNLTESSALQEAQKIGLEVVKLFNEKKFDDAFSLAQRVIAIRESAQGKNHIQVTQAQRNLAYIQFQRKKSKEAEDAFKKTFEIYKKNQPLSVEGETGKVIFACAITGAKELQRTSEIAAYQSKFRPTTLEGKPAKVSGVIIYNFSFQLEGNL